MIPVSPPTVRRESAAPAEKWSRKSRSAAARPSPISNRRRAIPAARFVKMAVDTYGKLDGVVNNAGHPARRDLPQMSIDAFEVRDQGAPDGFVLCRARGSAAVPREESGSFVHFTSTSGLVGNFGQANYAAAKLGHRRLSKSIALDMNRYNVRSNCVSPFAWSRLIGTIPTETEAEKARVAKIQQMDRKRSRRFATFSAGMRAREGPRRPSLRRDGRGSGPRWLNQENLVHPHRKNRPVTSLAAS